MTNLGVVYAHSVLGRVGVQIDQVDRITAEPDVSVGCDLASAYLHFDVGVRSLKDRAAGELGVGTLRLA